MQQQQLGNLLETTGEMLELQFWVDPKGTKQTETTDLGVSGVGSRGSLPDFELSELWWWWLRPRFSAVDLGEVEPVRLKVDVHGVHTQVSPVLRLEKWRGKKKKSSLFSPFCRSRIWPPTLWLKVGVQPQHPKSPSSPSGRRATERYRQEGIPLLFASTVHRAFNHLRRPAPKQAH